MAHEKTPEEVKSEVSRKEIHQTLTLVIIYAAVACFSGFIVPAIGNLFSDLPDYDTRGWTIAATKARVYSIERKYRERWLEEDPENTELHILYAKRYLSVWLDEDERTREDLAPLNDRYGSMSESGEMPGSGIGKLVVAMMFDQLNDSDLALDILQRIPDPDFPYRYLVKGWVLESLDRIQEAEQAYLRELDISTDNTRVIRALAKLYRKQQSWDKLAQMLDDPVIGPKVPQSYALYGYLMTGQPINYIKAYLQRDWDNLDRVGFLAAVLIGLIWIIYLRHIDVFEPEKYRYLFLTVFAGAFFAFLSGPLFHVLCGTFGFLLKETVWSEFVLYFFCVGPIEELAKIIPLFLMIRFTREVNESVDYIIFAAAGALGFAVFENMLKFHEYALYCIDARGLICVITHMVNSCLIGYGIVLAKYKRIGSVRLNIALAFILASAMHGLYDFLISDVVRDAANLYWLLLVIMEIALLPFMINNALNVSEFFEETACRKAKNLKLGLSVGLSLIILVEYLALAYHCGPTLARQSMASEMQLIIFLIWFVIALLGTFHLHRGVWLPWSKRKRQKILEKLEQSE